MKRLMILNPENASREEIENYPIRKASRAVLMDSRNNIAILYVASENYYKLPGGGWESGEGPEQALHRECLEETGCDIHIIKEIGSIVEYRKIFGLTQLSTCFLAKVAGEKSNPKFTDEEINNNFRLLWLPYPEALQKVATNNAVSDEGKLYIVPRDTIFLREAKEFFPPSTQAQ